MTGLPIFVPDVLTVTALTVLAYAVGRRLTARLPFGSAAESIALSITLGLGTLAMLTFALGLLGLLQRWAVGGVLLAALAVGWPALPGRLSVLSALAALERKPALVVLGGFAAAVVVPLVMLALYPPLAGDATSFHLAAPKLHIAAERVHLTPYLRFPIFPMLNEMLFALMLLFAGDVAAQLVQCLTMLLVALLLYAWGDALRSPAGGLWAAALWLGSPLVVTFGTIAFIDSGLTLFVTASAYAFFKWMSEGGTRGWLLLSGVCAGFAAGAKYSALFFVAVFGLAVAYRSARERRWTPLLTFGLAAGLVGGPWYVYNALQTGNPVFPFFGRFFSYGPWTAGDLAAVTAVMRQYGLGQSLGDFLRLPWNLATQPAAFHLEAPLSPAYGLLPAVLVVGALTRSLRGVLAVTLGYVVFWFLTVQVGRYLFPVLPLLSLLTALTVERLVRTIPRRFGQATGTVLALLVAGVLVFPSWSFALARMVHLGPLPTTPTARHAYLSRWNPSYPAYRLLNERRGSRYRLYQVLDEAMAYFADGTFMGDWFGPGRYAPVFEALRDGRALHAELKRLGADHFLIWSRKYGGNEQPPTDEFFRAHFKPLYVQGAIALFEIVD
ncbi:MAG TPA: phospholipid carrier-dependent glycosyltransferase [Candidatus Acidoferrum sp.]|nr:phospholipid carrier-dependent glycosyltransferase [Candidatus Acidoferrum sp.]